MGDRVSPPAEELCGPVAHADFKSVETGEYPVWQVRLLCSSANFACFH